MEKSKKEKEKGKKKAESETIKPLKDFKFQFNREVFDLKAGESCEVPKMFLANLKTEKVIK